MFNYLRKHGENGQTAVMLAVAMIGLLAIVGLALDGGMLYWNQRRAQNGADAAAIAGVTAMVNEVLAEDYSAICGAVSETSIVNMVNQYAANNEVPDADTGQNIVAFYLIESSPHVYVELINPMTGNPWQVGDTGLIPCHNALAGLRVEASFPQDTFLAGVVGITATNVTVEASAVYRFNKWCTDFAVFGISESTNEVVTITGSDISVTNGGIHANGSLKIEGSASDGHEAYLEEGRPVEYGSHADNKSNVDKLDGGPDPSDPELGFAGVEPYYPPDDNMYSFEDFAPGGYIWNEVDSGDRFYISGNLNDAGVVDTATGELRDGLYVVEGSIQLQQADKYLRTITVGDPPSDVTIPWRATLVARGEIKFSGGLSTLPFARGVFIFTESNNTSNGAIQMSGSDNSWGGLILAPNGNANFSGANNTDLAGMIMANDINFSGSNVNINHRPEYCPANPPRVQLID